MKRVTKFFLFVICVSLIVASLVACNNEEEYVPVEEIVEEPTVVATSGELNDDIFSFEFSLNGEVFALPMPYSEFYEHGWAFDGSALAPEDPLEPNQRTFVSEAANNGQTVGISVGNLTPNFIEYYEGLIGVVRVNEFNVDSGTQFVLPGGITVGGSSLEDVLEAHGEPSTRTEASTHVSLVYTLEIQSQVRIMIDIETELVMEVEITNFTERQQAEFDGDLPEIAQGYVAPTALGSDWSVGIVELDGVIYQLPAPVGVFLANGWELVSDNEMVAAGRTSVLRNIRNGNDVMRVDIKNYDTVEQPLVNGFVVSIEYSDHFWTGNIALPGGVTEGSTRAQIMSAFGSPSRTEENQMFTVYEFGSFGESITVSLRNDDGGIQSIKVDHSLRELPW